MCKKSPNRSRKTIEENEIKLGQLEQNILVKGIKNQFRVSPIVPATVHKKQPLEKSELCDSIIGGSCSLEPFVAADSDADVRRLDHWNVVRTISNRQRDDGKVIPDQLDDICFLLRGYATAHDRSTKNSKLEELNGGVLVG